MDFSEFTNDELADAVKALVDELHARHGNMPESRLKVRVGRLLRVAHGALEAIKELLADDEIIQPRSGGDPKPPQEP